MKRFISMMTAALMILAALPVFTPAQVQARFPRGSAAAACAYAIDNGCIGANQNGSFQNASLLTSAQQSGQNSLLPSHPMAFNIPAVDYPIGPDKTLTPQDPRTINDGICNYVVASNPEFVACQATFNGQVVTETLNNYDFRGTKIGKGVVLLYLGGDTGSGNFPGAGSSITLTNDYFAVQPGPAGQGIGVGFLGNWSILFKNSQCDGTTANGTNSDACFRDDGDLAGTSLDVEYSAFTNTNVRSVIENIRYTALTFKYNFVQGMNDLLTTGHGELSVRACPLLNCTGSENYEGNFVVWNTTATGSVNNATFFPSSGDSEGIALSSVTIKNNIVVTNTYGSPATPSTGVQVGKALFNMRAATLGVVTITGNWMDATGSDFCGVNGTVQNGDGTASTSGNTINITALNSSFTTGSPIEPGYLIINPGFTTSSLTAFGTGTGSTGTYTFGGATQVQGSTSTWTIVPGYTGTPTLTPNWGLADPGHTGVPVAIGFSGPTMAESNCPGAH